MPQRSINCRTFDWFILCCNSYFNIKKL